MRVLMLTSTLPRFVGDMQPNFVEEQAEAWLSARQSSEITILAPHDAKAPLAEDRGRIKIERFRYMWPERAQALAYPAILPNLRRNPLLLGQLPLFLWAQLRAALRLSRERGFDCIYAHWVMPQGLVAQWLSKRTRIPYVLQTHSSDLTVFSSMGVVGKALAAGLLRNAVRFFCVNSGQLEAAKKFLPAAEHAALCAKSSVLPMGVARLVEANPSVGGPELGWIGRLTRKKGLDYLIAALEELHEEGLRPRLEIAGDGEEKDALARKVRRSDTRFLGFVTGTAKEAFLASCQRFVFPAKAYDGDVEGLPVALLEALMRGQPVLATRDTNIELLPEWEAIRDHIVFVSDPSDIPALKNGLRELLAKEPGDVSEVAQALGHYRWEYLIENYLDPIEQALAQGTPAT